MNDNEVNMLPDEEALWKWLEASGAVRLGIEKKVALIKINLANPPEALNPRTSAKLIHSTAGFLNKKGIQCIVIESANGFLEKNLRIIGLGDQLDNGTFECLDLDEDEAEKKGNHYLPNVLSKSDLRIGLAVATSKEGMIFSNAVKLHFGSVPQRYYFEQGRPEPRGKLHINLQQSVAEVYDTVQQYRPFNFHITAAPYVSHGKIVAGPMFASKNALQLDYHLADFLGVEPPEYLSLVKCRKVSNQENTYKR